MTNVFMNNYTHNSDNWAACQAGSSSCSKFAELVHAVFCAVCTFVFALFAAAILGGAIGVLISLAIINIIIGIIIIARENRIFKAKELLAA